MDRLSRDDVTRLLSEPSPEVRIATANKVATEYNNRKLSPHERQLAEAIFRIMVRSAEVRVRRALSETLKDNATVPHDVALQLASDIAAVATPMLRYSIVLTDEDLVQIVRTRPVLCQLAVAQRTTVSSSVSDALVDSQNEEVVVALINNSGAEVSDETCRQVLNLFPASEEVMNGLAMRPSLPVELAERLINFVSDEIREKILDTYPIDPDTVTDLVSASREQAILDLISPDATRPEIAKLVYQLHASGRLTPAIVLRAIDMGHLAFLEVALAKLAGIPAQNSIKLMYDKNPVALRLLFNTTGLPEALFEVVRIAVDEAKEMNHRGEADGREDYRQRLVENFARNVCVQSLVKHLRSSPGHLL